MSAGSDPVVVLENNLNELGLSFETLRAELLRNPNVKSVSSAAQPPWSDGGSHITIARSAAASATGAESITSTVMSSRVSRSRGRDGISRSSSIARWQVPCRIVGVVANGYPRLVGPNIASTLYALWPDIAGVPLICPIRETPPIAKAALAFARD